MHRAAVSAACVIVMLLSSRSATQAAPLYAVIAALPIIDYRKTDAMGYVAALAVTLAASWHPFDLVAASVGAAVSARAVSDFGGLS